MDTKGKQIKLEVAVIKRRSLVEVLLYLRRFFVKYASSNEFIPFERFARN